MRSNSSLLLFVSAVSFSPYSIANAQSILYQMDGDFPGNNLILAAAGIDLGPFSATFSLDAAGDPSTQMTFISINEASTGLSGLPDAIFEVTSPDTVTISAFVPAASAVFGLDTHVDAIINFGGPVALNGPLEPFLSGSLTLGVDHPQAGLLTEDGVISSLQIVPEPTSAMLLGIGTLGIAFLRRRK